MVCCRQASVSRRPGEDFFLRGWSHMKIYGVDFSGARSDSSTWLAQGSVEGGVLTLDSKVELPIDKSSR